MYFIIWARLWIGRGRIRVSVYTTNALCSKVQKESSSWIRDCDCKMKIYIRDSVLSAKYTKSILTHHIFWWLIWTPVLGVCSIAPVIFLQSSFCCATCPYFSTYYFSIGKARDYRLFFIQNITHSYYGITTRIWLRG